MIGLHTPERSAVYYFDTFFVDLCAPPSESYADLHQLTE